MQWGSAPAILFPAMSAMPPFTTPRRLTLTTDIAHRVHAQRDGTPGWIPLHAQAPTRPGCERPRPPGKRRTIALGP